MLVDLAVYVAVLNSLGSSHKKWLNSQATLYPAGFEL